MAKVSGISGFLEWLPEQQIVEERFVETVRTRFELAGFAPISYAISRAIEYIAKKKERLTKRSIPASRTKVSEEKAREIVLARGALARKRLEQAEGSAISAEQVADLLGLSRQGVDYLRNRKRVVA